LANTRRNSWLRHDPDKAIAQHESV
jgi:hypothetical protein